MLNDTLPDEEWQELVETPTEEYVVLHPTGRWGLVQIAHNGVADESFIYYNRNTLTYQKTMSYFGQAETKAKRKEF